MAEGSWAPQTRTGSIRARVQARRAGARVACEICGDEAPVTAWSAARGAARQGPRFVCYSHAERLLDEDAWQVCERCGQPAEYCRISPGGASGEAREEARARVVCREHLQWVMDPDAREGGSG